MEIPSTVHPSWHPYLKTLFESEAMSYIKTTLLPARPFSPSPQFIFRVLQMPLDEIRVVIIGKEPYRDPAIATGLAFSANNNIITSSLDGIIEEIALNVSINIFLMGGIDGEFDESLEHLSNQGVFLLNRSLTINQDGVSHFDYWKPFTDVIIRTIAEKKEGIIWMLWGKDTQSVTDIINDSGHKHNVLTAYHPADQYGLKLLGCKHFSMTNELLDIPIKWVNHAN